MCKLVIKCSSQTHLVPSENMSLLIIWILPWSREEASVWVTSLPLMYFGTLVAMLIVARFLQAISIGRSIMLCLLMILCNSARADAAPTSTLDRSKELKLLLGTNQVQSLGYGTVWSKLHLMDMSTSDWSLIVRQGLIEELPKLPDFDLCFIRNSSTRLWSGHVQKAHKKMNRMCDTFAPLQKKFAYIKRTLEASIGKSFVTMFSLMGSHFKGTMPEMPTEQERMDVRQVKQTRIRKDWEDYDPIAPTTPAPRDYMEAYYRTMVPNNNLNGSVKRSARQTNTDAPEEEEELDPESLMSELEDLLLQISQEVDSTPVFDDHEILSRQTRGAIAGIGSWLARLLGVATRENFQTLTKVMAEQREVYREMAGDYQQFKEDMITITQLGMAKQDLIYKAVNHSVQALRNLTKTINDIQTYIREEEITRRQEMIFYRHLLSDMVTCTVALLAYRDILLAKSDDIQSLNRGVLTPNLISPSELQTTLDELELVLLKDYSPFHIAERSSDYFYNTVTSTYLADNKDLVILIRVPLTDFAGIYHVYKSIVLPMPAGNNSHQFTQIQELPKYLGISESGNSYVTFGDDFLHECRGAVIKRCPRRLPEIASNQLTCPLAVFLSSDKKVQELCRIDLIYVPQLPVAIHDLEDNTFFISNLHQEPWSVACPDRRPTTIAPCKACVVRLKCRCYLRTVDVYLAASLKGCQNNSTALLRKHFVPNMAWISSISENQDVDDYDYWSSQSLLDSDPIEKLPPLPIPDFKEVEQYMDADKRITIELKKAVKQAQREEQIYISPFQEIEMEQDWLIFRTSSAIPLALTSLGVGTVVLIGQGVLVCKYMKMLAMLQAIMTVSNPPSVDAAYVDQETTNCQNNAIVSGYNAVILSAIFLIVWLAIVIYVQRKCRKSDKMYPSEDAVLVTKVGLKFCSIFNQVTIPFTQVSLPPNALELTPCTVEGESPAFKLVAGNRGLYLFILWKGMRLKHRAAELTLPLEPRVDVPWAAKNLLIQLLKSDTYEVYLHFMTRGVVDHRKICIISNLEPEPQPYVLPGFPYANPQKRSSKCAKVKTQLRRGSWDTELNIEGPEYSGLPPLRNNALGVTFKGSDTTVMGVQSLPTMPLQQNDIVNNQEYEVMHAPTQQQN